MTMHRKPRRRAWLGLALLCSIVELPLLAGPALAIVGRPLTPMSYAGVARRTTRRTVAVGAVAHPYYW